jgi:hypothetical protein
MNDRQFWYFLVNGQLDKETGAYANFYTYGTHLGDALSRTIQASSLIDLSNVSVIETTRLDNADEKFQLPDESKQLNEFVYFKEGLSCYDLDDDEPQFISPTGVLKSTDDGEHDYDLIKENFVAYGKNEEGIFEFELVVGKELLIETFITTIDFLPSVDGFWIYVWNHWDSKKTELWTAKHFVDKGTVIQFLREYKTSTLENGFIDCVVHSLTGQTNLTLDEHKKIQLHTKDTDLFNDFGKKIINLGFEQTKDFYNLEFGYHHWHYRPADSLDRDSFIKLLGRERFELIDTWD